MSEEEIINNCKSFISVLKDMEMFYTYEQLDYDKKYEKEKQYKSIQGLLDLYQKEKEKNKELEKDNDELRRLKNKLSIATAIALDGRKISISKKSLNELNDMFSIEVEYRPFYDDYVFYAK